VAAHILQHLGVSVVRLLTDNITKRNCLKAHGIHVAEVVPFIERSREGVLPPQGAQGGAGHDHGRVGARNGNGAAPHLV
jgi:GTP cyclohydrolase II